MRPGELFCKGKYCTPECQVASAETPGAPVEHPEWDNADLILARSELGEAEAARLLARGIQDGPPSAQDQDEVGEAPAPIQPSKEETGLFEARTKRR